MKKLILSTMAFLAFPFGTYAQCFSPVSTNTRNGPMYIYVSRAILDGVNLQVGDEIGVFDKDDCVGIGVLTEELTGEAPFLEIVASRRYHRIPGFTRGDTIRYRFCIGGEVSNHPVVPTYISNGPTFKANASCIVELHVINSPPVVLSVPLTEACPGVAYSYTIVAEDIDGDPLNYTALVLPGWLSFNSTTHTLSATPSEQDIGDQHVTIRISDGSLYTDHTFIISVDEGNHAPAFLSDPATSACVGESYEYTVIAQDIDNDSLTCSVPLLPDWLYFYPERNMISGVPDSRDIGSHELTIRVSDGTTCTEQHFTVEVRKANSQPHFTSTPLTNISAGEFYVYSAEAHDEDNDALSYSALSLPNWLSFDVNTHTLFGTPTNDNAGDHNVILQVSDGILTEDQIFVVNVDFVYSISELYSEEGIMIYPNPSNGKFYIELSKELEKELRLEIIDYLGSVLHQEVFPPYCLIREEFDLSCNIPGMYFIRIQDDTFQTLKKLMIY